ncbi:MAG TPA: RHS repeat-associated core domain-containing protein [Abditibacteriaceae bacterium]|jgi:RHS repeat-associated protein
MTINVRRFLFLSSLLLVSSPVWPQARNTRNRPRSVIGTEGQTANNTQKFDDATGVTTRPFTPDHFPNQDEVTALGGWNGALAPMSDANADKLIKERDDGIRAGAIGAQAIELQKRVQRLLDSNLVFAKIMNEWNATQFDAAVTHFDEFFKEYPESPWAGEALLHIAEAASANGRYTEAQNIYEYILNGTSGAADGPTYEIHQKTKQAWAALDIASGDNAVAIRDLQNILATERSWRRKGWAEVWLQRVSMRSGVRGQEIACGTQALGTILVKAGKTRTAARFASLQAPRTQGWSLAELERLADREGMALDTFALLQKNGEPNVESLATLPVPFIIHCGTKTTRPSPLLKIKGFGISKSGSFSATASPFRPSQRGHFWVVQSVDVRGRAVRILNPSDNASYRMTWKQLAEEWTGTGLASHRAIKQSRVARLPETKAVKIFGTGWGLKPAGGLGKDKELEPVKVSCIAGPNSPGEASLSVNKVNMNIFMEDTPLWYETPVGPDVQITMSYNSQESSNYGRAFRGKWKLNYETYVINESDGGATVVMPDGKRDRYTTSSFIATPGNYKKLTRQSPTSQEYVLTFPGGETWKYGGVLNTTSPRLYKMTDRWGKSLLFNYAFLASSNYTIPMLVKITDALSRETILTYDAQGYLQQVTDPFGRFCVFTPSTANSTVASATDMGGNTSSYTYDSANRAVSLTTSRGTWNILDERSDSRNYSTYEPATIYPQRPATSPRGDYMGQNWRVTITDPLSKREEYYYSAKHLRQDSGTRSWHVDKNHWKPYTSLTDNNGVAAEINSYTDHADLVKKTSYILGLYDGEVNWYITKVRRPHDQSTSTTNPDVGYSVHTYEYDTVRSRVAKITSPENQGTNQVTTFTYNNMGNVTSMTDPHGNTTIINYVLGSDIDVASVVDPLGRTVVSYRLYNTAHQPQEIEDGLGNVTSINYQTWGAVDEITEAVGDPLQRTTKLGYDSLFRLSNVKRSKSGALVTVGSYGYDTKDRVNASTDARGYTTSYEYNNLNLVEKVIYPDTSTIDPEWCNCGLLDSVTDRAGNQTVYEYDELKRLKKVKDAMLRTTQNSYDAVGNLKTLTDERGKVTTWYYDDANRVSGKSGADSKGETWLYDLNSNVIQYATEGSGLSLYEYDAADNLKKIDRSGSSADVEFTYDEMNRPYSMTDHSLSSTGTTTSWRYTVLGQMRLEDGPWSYDGVVYEYDALGRRKKFSAPGSTQGDDVTTYTWDSLDRLEAMTSPGGPFDYGFTDGNSGLVTQLLYPNGVRYQQSYDNMGRLGGNITEKVNGTPNSLIASYIHSPFPVTSIGQPGYRDGIRTIQTTLPNTTTQTTTYGYDSTNRLQSEKSGGTTPVVDIGYSYDLAGNRDSLINKSGPGGQNFPTSSIYTSNNVNQYQEIDLNGPSGYSVTGVWHDDNGNMKQLGSRFYTYDSANRLTQHLITDPNTGDNVSRTNWNYDGMNRVKRAVLRTWNTAATPPSWNVNSEELFVYDGMNVIQERKSDNTVAVSNTWGLDVSGTLGGAGGIGGLLSRVVRNGSAIVVKHYVHTDGRGNVIALTKWDSNLNATDAVVGRYSYDSFGASATSIGVDAAKNPYRYQSKRYYTNANLSDFGLRFYNSGMGRFINRDPIRESGGINMYAYVGNNPVNAVDPHGELAILAYPVWVAVGGIATVVTGVVVADQLKKHGGDISLPTFHGTPQTPATDPVLSFPATPSSPFVCPGRGTNKLKPDSADNNPNPWPKTVDGPHTTWRPGHTAEWWPNPQNPTGWDEVSRTDQTGAPHDGVPTPHRHNPDGTMDHIPNAPFPTWGPRK